MRRPLGEVLRAWLVLLPAALRIGIRLARRSVSRRPSVDVWPVRTDTPAGAVSFGLGTRQPIRVDGRAIGRLTSHDDAGTSTAEAVVTLATDTDPAAAVAFLTAMAGAAFARGNRRSAVWACQEEPVLIAALTSAVFQLEGDASPPWGDTRAWTMWARLSTDPPVA